MKGFHIISDEILKTNLIGNWIVSEPSHVDDNPAFNSAPVPEAEDVQNGAEICDPSDNEEGSVLEEEAIQELPSKAPDEMVTKADSDLSAAQEKKSYASIVSSKYTQFFILQFLHLFQYFTCSIELIFWQLLITKVKVAKTTARPTPVYIPTSNAGAAPRNTNQQAHVPEKASPDPQGSAYAVDSAPGSSNIQEEGKYQVFREYCEECFITIFMSLIWYRLDIIKGLYTIIFYLIVAMYIGYSIYVRNLPLNATAQQLEEEFKIFGSIKPDGIQVRSNKVCLKYLLLIVRLAVLAFVSYIFFLFVSSSKDFVLDLWNLRL